MRFERREFPDCRPGTGGIVHRGSRKLIQQRADSLGHFRPRSPLDAVDGDDLERRGIAAHDGGDGVGRWCADSARWASSGRHVDHRDRRRVMISM